MGLMDKAREAALKATAQAQQVAQQGQAKMQAAQQGRSHAQLFQALGEAVYAERRSGGDPAAVEAALQAIDAHLAANPPGAAAAPGAMPPGGAPGAMPPAAPGTAAGTGTAAGAPAAPAGDFTLDDL